MNDLQNFMIQSDRFFTTTNEAIHALRALGEPRSQIDSSEPSQRLQNVLEIVAFLTRRVMSSTKADVLRPVVDCIHRNWSSLLSPWIMFLLETFAVFDGESRTKHSVEFRDRVLGLIPPLISYTMCSAIPDKTKEIQDLTQKSPFLFPLMTRIWIKTVAKSHWTWRRWSIRVADTIGSGPDTLFSQFVEALKDVHKTDDIVAVSIAHLVNQGPDICVHGIAGFRDSVFLLDNVISPATPFYHPFFEQGGIRALVNLLSTLSRSEAWDIAEDNALYTFSAAQHVANMLLKAVSGSLRAMSDALDFGLIKVFFRAHRLYEYDRNSVTSQNPRALTCWKFSQVMQRIAGCLVYPGILRRFLRAMKVVAKLGLEERLQPRPSYFWPLWQSTTSRALDLRTMLDNLNMEARMTCGYAKVGCLCDLNIYALFDRPVL
uniref:Uncharacterized protein n=1 Tax=Moniliophthora roreri TaxID=221103 RepID=A0A0W0FSE6_MONRR